MHKLKILIIILLSTISINLFAQTPLRVNGLVIGGANTDIFYQPYERIFNVYTIGLGFKTPKISLYTLYNAGQLTNYDSGGNLTYSAIDDQFELDFYHNITKTTLYWLNYAYSPDEHFPTHRAMGRVWQKLGAEFLVSGGIKYYYFDDDLFTFTAGLEKYIGRFWIEGKTFIYLKEPDTKFAYQLNSRIFWDDVNYVQLTLMTGSAQDEPWLTTYVLTAHTIRLSVVSFLNKIQNLQLRANIGYSYEEYAPETWRNRYMGGFTITYYMF